MKQLDKIVENEDWSTESFVEHDYSLPAVTDCILYCMTADLIKRMMNTVKCLHCKNAFLNPSDGPTIPEAALTEFNGTDAFYHPNTHLYRFIVYLESRFVIHCNSNYVFEAILNDIFALGKVSFPCSEHASSMLIHIIRFFTMTRMQLHCNQLNADQKKTNQLKKKASKWTES